MKPTDSWILTINGGWSTIKFDVGDTLRRTLEGAIERLDCHKARFEWKVKIRPRREFEPDERI